MQIYEASGKKWPVSSVDFISIISAATVLVVVIVIAMMLMMMTTTPKLTMITMTAIAKCLEKNHALIKYRNFNVALNSNFLHKK